MDSWEENKGTSKIIWLDVEKIRIKNHDSLEEHTSFN